MKLTIQVHEKTYKVDLQNPIDLSLPIKKGGVKAWHANEPLIAPETGEGWTGSIESGFSVNFYKIGFNPHSHGTHTECLGHITKEKESLEKGIKNSMMLCRLLSVSPDQNGAIQLSEIPSNLDFYSCEAIVFRTLPNDPSKKQKNYSGQRPPYFSEALMTFFKEKGILHFLTDLPSVDPEDDGGKLVAHKSWFGVPDKPRNDATITELIFVPTAIEDGLFFLNLQLSAFDNDAVPSRPVLFSIQEL